VVEAMANGLPIVAFNQGGPSEMIKDGVQGILLEENDAIAERVALLFSDKDLRGKMGEAGKKRAHDFSLEKHVRRMNDVFVSLSNEEKQ
ncbi:MAG: glycosyltransferase, partial [Ghiorsea sp.]